MLYTIYIYCIYIYICILTNKLLLHLCPPPAAPQVMSSQPQGGRVRRRPFGHFLQHHGGLGHALLLAAQRGAVLVRAVSPEGHGKSMGNPWEMGGKSWGYLRDIIEIWGNPGKQMGIIWFFHPETKHIAELKGHFCG